MTFSEKVQFLKSYEQCKDNLIAYQEQITDLELSMLPKGLHISDLPRRPGSDDPLGDFGAKFWQIDQKARRTQKKMLQIIAAINQIENKDPKGHRLLVEQYIQCKQLKEIERNLHISANTRRAYHNKAVKEIDI